MNDRDASEPFFLWFAPLLPLHPYTAPAEFSSFYRERRARDHLVAYYANISWLDDVVGELLDFLDQSELAENTLVGLLADNGFRPTVGGGPASHRLSKGSAFELGVRTPILLRWPRRLRPATIDDPVSSVDLAPTLLAAAGLAREAADLPGVDLLPVAEGSMTRAGRPVFGASFAHPPLSRSPARDLKDRWVRRGGWKLIVPVTDDPVQLYQVPTNPHKNENLASTNAELVAELEQLLDAWWNPAAP